MYIQDTRDTVLRFAESIVSGELVSINASSMGGEHLVFVYPIWSSDIPDGRLAPALSVVYNLTASVVTTIPTSDGKSWLWNIKQCAASLLLLLFLIFVVVT